MLIGFWLLVGLTVQAALKLYWMKDPPRWPWATWILAAAGGVGGGWLYQTAWPVEGAVAGIDAAATAVGAVIGAIALLYIARFVIKPPPEG